MWYSVLWISGELWGMNNGNNDGQYDFDRCIIDLPWGFVIPINTAQSPTNNNPKIFRISNESYESSVRREDGSAGKRKIG